LVATDRLSGAELVKVVVKVAAVLLVGILVQTCFGNDLRVDDVAPDFMLLLAVCAGFVAGPDEGALVGFVAGLLSDLFLQNTPFGLMALAACLAGYVVGWARANFLRPHRRGDRARGTPVRRDRVRRRPGPARRPGGEMGSSGGLHRSLLRSGLRAAGGDVNGLGTEGAERAAFISAAADEGRLLRVFRPAPPEHTTQPPPAARPGTGTVTA
jgi:hypothetical protein